MNDQASEWFADEQFWQRMSGFMFSDARFAAAAGHVPQLIALSGVSTGNLLDLACGPGRYAIPFALAGFAVTGVDRSKCLLDMARKRAVGAGAHVEWIEEDMRKFVRPLAYDLALNVFTSLGYFDAAADNRRVLENVYTSLRTGGVFVFDHIGKELLAARFQPTISEPLGDNAILIQRTRIIDGWSRVAGEWTVLQGEQATTFHNCHWLYSAQEITELLASVGFAEIRIYGSLAAAPYQPGAERLIAVARKP